MTDFQVLEEIKNTLGLGDAAIAQLAGLEESTLISRNGTGIPEDFEERIAPLVYVTQFMREWYVEAVIPELVRRPLPELDDRSVLDALAHDPHSVISHLSRLFYLPEM